MALSLKGSLLGTEGNSMKENALWKGSRAEQQGVLERQAEA